jgi:glutathione S-transferase/GST-like protein
MGVIVPTNTEVESFKGLHLYHTGFSNCAMRVRIALEEKGLEWTSHPINLLKGENLTKEYFGINPNGVVPTLVDNGVVIIESTDIIDYLDKKYSPGSLRPKSEKDEKLMYEWMYLASNNHLFIKTYMYGNVKGGPDLKKSAEQMDDYRQKQTFNSALLAFHERFNSNEGFTKEDLDKAATVIDDCFERLNSRLLNNDWLAGKNFSLADIAWIPQLVILKAANYPFENYPNLEEWKNSIVQRPSFKKGVLAWLPTMKK